MSCQLPTPWSPAQTTAATPSACLQAPTTLTASTGTFAGIQQQFDVQQQFNVQQVLDFQQQPNVFFVCL